MIELRSGGSGRGYHHALSYAGCPRRATASAFTERRVADTPEPMLVGSVGHEMLRRWRIGIPVDDNESWSINGELIPKSVVDEAARVYQAYKMTFNARDFGEVIATEMHFPVDEDHAKKIKSVLGSERTGSADLVVRCTEEDISRLVACGVEIPRAPNRLFIVDDKFERDGGEYTILNHRHSLQFQTYMIMYALAYGEEPAGAIVNVLVKNKTPKFIRIFVPPPTPTDILALRKLFSIADAKEQTPDEVDPTRCFEKFRVCPLFTAGTCKRF